MMFAGFDPSIDLNEILDPRLQMRFIIRKVRIVILIFLFIYL